MVWTNTPEAATSRRTRLGQRLAAQLEERILSGEWGERERIPPERALATSFGVSRATIREALDELMRSGLVIRHQGSGTYVAPRRLGQSLLGHFSIVDALRANGGIVTTVSLGQEHETARPAVARALEIPAGDPTLSIERLRLSDGEAFMLERTWLPLRRLPGLGDQPLDERGLYATLREDYSTTPVRALESFEPVLLNEDEARRLRQRPGDPALLLLRTTYDADDVPVELARAVLRGDLVRPLVERRVHEDLR